MKNTLARSLLILGGITLLAGCNKLKLGYEYADWLVIFSVEDNFELDRSQRNHLKDDVESYFRWNRKQMLPLYADLLARATDSLKTGLKPAGLDTGYHEFMSLYRKTMAPVVGKAVTLLQSLNKRQIEAYAERQKKKNQKLRKDFSGGRDEQLERRYRKTIGEIEDWTGRLNPAQKQEVRSMSFDLPWNGDLWLENREKIQGRLLILLRNRAPREELRKFLEDYFLYPERMRTEAYRLRYQESQAKIGAMVVRIHALLTPEQKRHFFQQVEKFTQDLRTLSKQD